MYSYMFIYFKIF